MAAGWKYFTTQQQWKNYLQDLVCEDNVALLRAIVLIDNWQTEPERKAGESTEENNVGWSKYDAKEMGAIAEKIRKCEPLEPGEVAKSRNKMKKYWKQLILISQEQQKRLTADQQAEAQKKVALERFKKYTEVLRACKEDGIACEFGICDECPVTRKGA